MKCSVKAGAAVMAVAASFAMMSCSDSFTNGSAESAGLSRAAENNEPAYNVGEGTYFFISKCSNKSLDNSDWSVEHGANVAQWKYGGDQENQDWVLRNAGNGYYYIINKYSGYALDGNDWGTTDGTNILQWDLGYGQSNQMWKFVIQRDSSFKIVNKHSGLVMDVAGASKDDGANVQLWTWNGTDAQKWFITKISDSMTTGTGRKTSGGSLMAGATDGKSVTGNGRYFIGSGKSYTNLVWSDEFEGNTLNRSNWTFDTGNNGWGNSELENYTDGANVSVGNGVMTITADASLDSARLLSKGLKEFQYGKIEARLRTDQGTGSWPAFWMLGTGSNGIWPYCGEIDIMEHSNNDRFVFETCHWNGNGKNTGSGYNHASWGQTSDNNFWNVMDNLDVSQWHIYGIEWSATQIRFYVDGIQVMACDTGNAANGTDCFNAPFYILFNFAMGGQFTGIYNAGQFTNVPWHMYVDYVRCYQ